jgi:hypothetical protein
LNYISPSSFSTTTTITQKKTTKQKRKVYDDDNLKHKNTTGCKYNMRMHLYFGLLMSNFVVVYN